MQQQPQLPSLMLPSSFDGPSRFSTSVDSCRNSIIGVSPSLLKFAGFDRAVVSFAVVLGS